MTPKTDPPAQLLRGAEKLFAVDSRRDLARSLEAIYRARIDGLTGDETMSARANRATAGAVTLHYCRYDAPVRIAFDDMPGFRQFFCLAGAGRIRAWSKDVELSPRQTGILPPGSRFEAEYGAGYAHLVIQVDEAALARAHQAWDPAVKPDRLHLAQSLDADGLGRLRSLALCLADQFDDPAHLNLSAVTALQGAVVSSFLFDNLLRGRPVDGPASGPGLAERLRDYLEAHWNEPIGVESMAQACGVSVRSVFQQFGQQFGATPMAYLRNIRLDRARDLLSEPDSGLSVIDAALRCGFSSFGHFARRYRERFGELPSDTLTRARWS